MTWSTESLTWRSGRWSLQLREDEFADITFDGRPVLRSVRAVVRDRDWGTAGLTIDRVRDSGATLSLHVRSEGLGSSFRGVVRVEARATQLVVIADLESEHEYATNRTGLVVLHPPQLAGQALRVTHTDGSVEETSFPRAISPHQPVFDIAELAWLHQGSEVAVSFEGDVFEMEDQRNWSDASYKTYSRPLGLQFPYVVEAGERVRQSVTISVREVALVEDRTDSDVIELHRAGVFPTIAVGAATAPDPAPAQAPAVTAPLGTESLVELDLATPTWPAALDRAAASGLPLDVRLITPRATGAQRGAAMRAAARRLRETGCAVVRIAAYDPESHITDADTAVALRAALTEAGIAAPVVGGTRSHFTELNREQHRVAPNLDGITFTTTPLFHTLRTEQLVESLAMQRLIARQAAGIAAGLPVHIGPVALRARFNNVATAPEPAPARADLSEGYGTEFTSAADPRQASPELTSWTIASVAALAVPEVASIALFEEWGARGIRSKSGEAFPVAEAISWLSALHGAQLLSGESPDGIVWAIGGQDAASVTVLAANAGPHPRTVTVRLPDSDALTVSLAPTSATRIVRPLPHDARPSRPHREDLP